MELFLILLASEICAFAWSMCHFAAKQLIHKTPLMWYSFILCHRWHKARHDFNSKWAWLCVCACAPLKSQLNCQKYFHVVSSLFYNCIKAIKYWLHIPWICILLQDCAFVCISKCVYVCIDQKSVGKYENGISRICSQLRINRHTVK